MKLATWIIFTQVIIYTQSFAEPWLASRFSQNCAGCHAPGRKNLPLKDRRCSLSCQGCHTNPNGGGVRNAYGKWNENHWLKSTAIKALRQKGTTAPYQQQDYRRKRLKRVRTYPIEANYDRHDGKNYQQEAISRSDFEKEIPYEDPYYTLKRSKLSAGGDIRFQSISNLNDDSQKSFLMSADLGLVHRPFAKHLSLVVENRLLGQISGSQYGDQSKQWRSKSLYALVDDLPFNTFLMGGYYKPLFGNDSPDHTRLSRRIVATTLTGSPNLSYALLYRGVSAGTAPNVPYLNVHLIDQHVDESEGAKRSEGIVVNTGLRFVSYGASLNYTLWSQRIPEDDIDTRILMHNVYATSTLGFNRFHLGLEAISAQVERGNDFYRVAVFTLEGFYRLWREAYLAFDMASSNSLDTLNEGTSQQYKVGVKWFAAPGVEVLSQFFVNHIEKDGEDASTSETISTQLHLYF